MRIQQKFLALVGLAALFGSASYAATLTGTVKGPDGAPFEGAFVEAQNIKTRMDYIALTDSQGHYRSENIPAGDYRVQVKAAGYKADSQTTSLTADQNTSFDFALAKGVVHWNDISIYQAKRLLPASPGKDLLFAHCFVCHGFQTRMAAVRRDEDGWKDRVQFMRDAMKFSLGYRFSDQDAAEVASFLNASFGQDATLARSPAELPDYKATIPTTFSNEAMNIKFVEYDMPGASRMPFSAAYSKDGYVWIPNFGLGDKITRLDPKTAEMQDFPVPFTGTAAVHSAVEARDGSVWLTEQGPNRIGKWDPKTQKITEYQDAYLPGKEGEEDAGSKHTIRFDPDGNVWSTGYPLSRFDPETGKFTDFWGIADHTYGLEPDKDGNIWFTNPGTGQLGKADWKTLKIKQWTVPTKNGYERRLAFDSQGIIWFGEYENGKIGRFDPKTETFKEYDLPGGKDVFPYAVGIDADDYVWYSSYYRDTLGRLDPKTGKITEYPFPHSENTIREFFRDPEGRMWYGSPSNNKVGYFYLTGGTAQAKK